MYLIIPWTFAFLKRTNLISDVFIRVNSCISRVNACRGNKKFLKPKTRVSEKEKCEVLKMRLTDTHESKYGPRFNFQRRKICIIETASRLIRQIPHKPAKDDANRYSSPALAGFILILLSVRTNISFYRAGKR